MLYLCPIVIEIEYVVSSSCSVDLPYDDFAPCCWGGVRVIAMAKSIEGRTKATYSDDKVYSIVTDLSSTLTTAYNAEGEEVGCIGSI